MRRSVERATAPLLEPVDRPMRRLFGYLRPHRLRLGFAAATSTVNKVLDLAPPLLVGWLVDVAGRTPPEWIASAAGRDAPGRQIALLAGLTVVVFALESVFQWAYTWGFMTLAQNVQHALRIDAYRRMQDREIEFFEEHRLGQTLAMLNDDVNQLERFLNTGLNTLVQLTVLVLFCVTVMSLESWPLALVSLAPVPVIVWGSFRFSRRLEPRYRGVREAVGELAARVENNVAGILVIKSFTAEEFEAGRVEEASDAYRRANVHAIRLSAAFVPIIRMAIAVGFAGVIALGGWWALDGRLSVGALVMFCMLIQRMLWPLTTLGQTFDDFQRAGASAARVFSLLGTPSRVRDPERPTPLPRGGGEVVFDRVEFTYRRGLPVIRGLDLVVAPGETVGIAGPTGAGKTTIVKLLLRLYDVTAGAVRIDGVDVRAMSQRELRRRIALVSQDVYLFHGTIRENIAYGREEAADDAEGVAQAARLAHLHDFIETLPEGYDTVVGERGIKLSGGQRQRLSLARAILKDAPILVLDEATSSVDTETERAIQENLRRLTAGRTALVIAHRLSTIRQADRIVVLRDGRVVETGRHDELVELGGLYADLWSVQSGVPRTLGA